MTSVQEVFRAQDLKLQARRRYAATLQPGLPDLRVAGKQAELGRPWIETWRRANTPLRFAYVGAGLVPAALVGLVAIAVWQLALLGVLCWWLIYRRPRGWRWKSLKAARRRYAEEEKRDWERIQIALLQCQLNREREETAALEAAIKRGEWVPEKPARTRHVSQTVKVAVAARDGGSCRHCGSTDDLHFDHIYAWSKGGENTVDNLQILCGPCNRRKGAR